MSEMHSIHEYLKNKIYKKAKRYTLSKEEVDALLIILSYIMDALEMPYTDIKKLNWDEETSVVFNNNKNAVISVHVFVYDHFGVPLSHNNTPFKDPFKQGQLLGDMIVDMKEHVVKHINSKK